MNELDPAAAVSLPAAWRWGDTAFGEFAFLAQDVDVLVDGGEGEVGLAAIWGRVRPAERRRGFGSFLGIDCACGGDFLR